MIQEIRQNTNQPLLRAEHISKTFSGPKGAKVPAVRDVSFSIRPGESLGIVGESGSGKSTIARMITGLTPLSAGEIYLNGSRICGLNKKEQRETYRHIQMVFQDPYSAISPRMSIGTFLGEGLVHFGMMNRSDADQEAKKLLGMVDLSEDLMDRLPHQLSGGQLQRVVIARAISIRPKLIILDEATSALDVSVQKQILHLLVRLREQFDLTYLFIGHDLAVVRSITNRICVMKDGQIIEEISSASLQQEAENPYTIRLLESVFSVRG